MSEIILTTEETGQLWSACVWDPRTGTALMTYKGANAAGPRSASFLGNDYLLLTDKIKPVLNAWPLNSQQPETTVKFDCMGKVNAMAVTQDGFYVVTAVGNNLIVWQTASGRQLAVLTRHFQPVTCVKFTRDGSNFISGGEDGLALVWDLAYVVSVISGEVFPEQTKPLYVFSDHTLPIQDIYVGYGGIRARFVTVSLDRSCRIYDLSCGQLIATVIFAISLSAVTMDAVETMIFVGALNGNIFQLDLTSPRTREHHVTDEEKGKVFAGHCKVVTCLSVSQDGMILLSGSYDRQVILWDIPSRQSFRTIEHKGSITNAFFAMAPKQMFSDEFKPVLVLNTFHKSSGNLIIKVRTTEDQWETFLEYKRQNATAAAAAAAAAVVDETDIKDKLMELTKKNADLYKFSMEKIFEVLDSSAEKRANEKKPSNSGDSKLWRKKKAQPKHK